MSKALLVVLVFLVIGGLLIKYDTDSNGGDFLGKYLGWLKVLGGNVRSVTTNAVIDYTWLPNTTLNGTKSR